MPFIDLNRRFLEWNETEPPDPEMRLLWGLDDGAIGWEEVLSKRRVVILAEAGSGKSTEFAERASVVAREHKYVFHSRVDDVGRDGLDDSLSVDARRSLTSWRKGVDEAWFFIDSVDEAKVAGVRFDQALRKLAEGIRGAEERCHILLSGRITDWETQRDAATLRKWLPVSSVVSKPEPTAEEELLRIVRNERRSTEDGPANEAPFIAVMAQLDRNRVRTYAAAVGIPGVEQFLETIDDADLWHFARRPLDLDWLVRFWQTQGRLGTLAEMLGLSVDERLRETNSDRARADGLNSEAALKAVERIGAAMVFGRQATVTIPDHESAPTSGSSLDLADVLPDWSGDSRLRLLTRPVFDPATLGRVRFHNDNEGVVRSYLTARWLIRLRAGNLSTASLFRLLFANSYGLEVIRPSLNETVAWLCLWDRDVMNEVVRRAPGLLLTGGDPASLSVGNRSTALAAFLCKAINEDQEWPFWSHESHDKLRRFARSDLGDTVLSLWPQYRAHKEAARLLMRLVWLGKLPKCEPIVREVAFNGSADPRLRALAGKALLETADQSTLASYAALIMADPVALPPSMLGDGMMELFPAQISISDVLHIISRLDIGDRNVLDFASGGVALAQRLKSAADLESFLSGLLGQLNSGFGEHSHVSPSKREEALFPAIAEAALRLLKAAHAEEAPEAAIDAILRILNRRDHASFVRDTADDALTELHRTPKRRRQAFWRSVTIVRAVLPEKTVDQPWHIRFLGYSPSLKVEDIDWLIEDGRARGGADCRLAVNEALAIYVADGKPESLLAKIRKAVEPDIIARQAFVEWTSPRVPSQAELDLERDRQGIRVRNKAELDKRHQFWIDFIREIRSDSNRIARLRLPVSVVEGSDLVHLWRLLDAAVGKSRHAIDSVLPLERIAGQEVANAAADGLIAHWRAHEPLVRSRKEPQQHNSVLWVDPMGLTGVTLEAAREPLWAKRLSAEEARRATEFATLELNGFPRWLSDLVASHPEVVSAVLYGEITDELTREDVTFFQTLQAVTHSNYGLATLLAPALLQDLEAGLPLPQGAVSSVLQILVDGLAESERERFTRIGISRFEQLTDGALAVQYLAAVFSISPAPAVAILLRTVGGLEDGAQANLVDRFLTACFGDSMSGSGFQTITAPPPELIEELTLLSFKTHRQAMAKQRPAGVVYRMDDRDFAVQARSAIFNRFVKTPGSATYHALRRLQEDSTCPVKPSRLRALAEERAVEDSESAPWAPREAFAFEQSAETSPRTDKDLRSVLIGRIEDMQHELLHDDFSQAQTLKGLTPEREVQKWVADRLRLRQGRSYSVEREPHVVDENEPDVRIRARATDVSVSMEIKVAGERWTLADLDAALEDQLCGRYLRSHHGRYGVLLLVHQEVRPRGWEDKANGTFLTFPEVVARLRARALVISGESHASPQPEVAALDVSAI